ncbi:hypothetical protein FOL47_006840 [Perkinsus chesapeaki]|uniref:Protein kinase domain-containing protein n=1 Tax=Perkinsus chesapeaki TaxID=330153 RepID=A0A7J6LPJ8_PERCH|nr:hypothetical protein FOL47_006840 [Perkinsus chesapeaki]
MIVANHRGHDEGSVQSLTSSAESISYAEEKYRKERDGGGHMSFEMKGFDDGEEPPTNGTIHSETSTMHTKRKNSEGWSAARRRSALAAIPQPPTSFKNPPPRLVSLTTVDRTNPVVRATVDCKHISKDDQVVQLHAADLTDRVLQRMLTWLAWRGMDMLRGRIYMMGDGDLLGNPVASKSFYDYSGGRGGIGFVGYFGLAPSTSAFDHQSATFATIRESLESVMQRAHLYDTCDNPNLIGAPTDDAPENGLLCIEDLISLKKFKLVESYHSIRNLPLEWPRTRCDRPVALPRHRGYRPRRPGTWGYIFGAEVTSVNQAGLAAFLHLLIMTAGFKVRQAELVTSDGKFVNNRYIISTYAPRAAAVFRARFSTLLPAEGPMHPVGKFPHWLRENFDPQQDQINGYGSVWYENDPRRGAYTGELVDSKREGFGRFWIQAEGAHVGELSAESYEGEWVQDEFTGYGFKVTEDAVWQMGQFDKGKLVSGISISPFTQPINSVWVARDKDGVERKECVYKVHVRRAEEWRYHMMNMSPVGRVPLQTGPDLPELYDSAILPLHCMDRFEIAAWLELMGLRRASLLMSAKSYDGEDLERMLHNGTAAKELDMTLSQVNALERMQQVLLKACSIDRHMRSPVAVTDALSNPVLADRHLPMQQINIIDTIGEGAYGRVQYAQYTIKHRHRSRSSSSRHLGSNRHRLMSEDELTRARLPSVCPSSPPMIRSAAMAIPLSMSELQSPRSGMSSAAMLATSNMNTTFNTSSVEYLALKEQVGSETTLENATELLRETYVLHAVCGHKNVVSLAGIAADPNTETYSRRFLATQLLESSLPAIIYAPGSSGPDSIDLNSKAIHGFALDMACGLAYMHHHSLVHGDVKSPNVLVDLRSKPPTAKLCDFGHSASRVVPRYQRRMCTFGWASPESLRDDDISTPSDVWSWACIVWEMTNREIPWRMCSHSEMVAAVGMCGLHPGRYIGNGCVNAKMSPLLKRMTERCWVYNPEHRLTMRRCVKALRRFKETTIRRCEKDMWSLFGGGVDSSSSSR